MPPPVQTQDPRIVALPAAEIRRRFVEFFAERGHAAVPSASLVPAGDQTLLFTNSGMVQFKDVLIGAETRSYTRAVDYQRCLRVAGKHNDFEEVGRTPRHHTFFEMLGNWSFGDYFKREAIHFAWDFLTRDLGHPGGPAGRHDLHGRRGRLVDLARRDRPAARADGALGRRRQRRRQQLLADGRDRAVRAVQRDPLRSRRCSSPRVRSCIPDHCETCPRWLEIWNLVFMEFDQLPDGRVPLPFTSVDTGMGLERLASVLQQVPTNYDTDLFTPIHARMRELLGHDPDAFETERFSYQVIADHSRAVTFLIGDDVLPSNEGRGYVLRKLFRRAVRHGRLLGRREPFMAETAERRHRRHGRGVPAPRRRGATRSSASSPARRPSSRGRSTPARSCSRPRSPRSSPTRRPTRSSAVRPTTCPPTRRVLPGDVAFKLHDTYGFPIDLTVELAAEYGVAVDRDGFERGPRRAARPESRSGTKAAALEARRARRALRRDPRPRRRHAGSSATRRRPPRAACVAILRDGMEFDELTGHGEAEVVLDRTPFYAEGGGQVGDHGVLREPGGGSELFTVTDTQKPLGGLIVHRGTLHGRLRVGETGRGGRRRGAARRHDAQPHGHAPAPSGAAQRGRRARPPGRLAGDARLPALRLPVRPRR